jgi:hypothetical protein
MDTQFDPVPFIVETRFNGVSAVLVIDRLALAAPDDLSSQEKKALRAMQSARDEVERVRQERATNAPAKVRPPFVACTAAWGGVSDVLAATAALPIDIGGDKAEHARGMQGLLFPDGGAPKLAVDAETAYLEARERLDRVEQAGARAQLVALVGREHVDAIEKTTEALADALGVGKTARTSPSSTAMQEALGAASQAVARYARRLLGAVDEEDDASIQRFTSALAPLADHRDAISRGTTTTEPDPAPTPPVTNGGLPKPVATPPS